MLGGLHIRRPYQRQSDVRESLVTRCLSPHEDWERISGEEYYRMSGWLRGYLPDIDQILSKHHKILFLGGPGMGLTSLAFQIQRHLTAKDGQNPMLVSLRDFEGNLSVIPTASVVTAAADSATWYLLDDLDQVASVHLPQLIAELIQIDSKNASCRVALFARQGYAAALFAPFDGTFERYYLLGLTPGDIQQLCDAAGINSWEFERELERLDLIVEAGNPSVLQTLTKLFCSDHRLPSSRAEVLEAIVSDLTTSTGPVVGQQWEALCALGLAMELTSRNFLAPAEAELAIGAWLDLSPPQAATLLRTISVFLLYTVDGISLPHHSFGEYLAACTLSNRPLSVVLDAIFLPGTRIPNPSWRLALGFLAEMHPATRRYLVAHHPELALAASPVIFTKEERAAISRTLYDRLRTRGESIFRHPEISATRLARCLPDRCFEELEHDATQHRNPTLTSNAFLLLGEAGANKALPLALATALDSTIDSRVRESAFHCIGRLGTPAIIPRLIASVTASDSCYVSMLISVSMLADAPAIPLIMPALLTSQTHVTSTYDRLRRLPPKPTALALLETIRQQPGLVDNPHWRFYAGFLPEAIQRGWDNQIAASLTDAMVAIEEAQVFDLQNDFMKDLAAAIRVRDKEETVVRELLRRFRDRGKPVIALARTLLHLSSPATVRWLLEQPRSDRLVSSLRMYARRNAVPSIRGGNTIAACHRRS